jgi:hypothetical protein
LKVDSALEYVAGELLVAVLSVAGPVLAVTVGVEAPADDELVSLFLERAHPDATARAVSVSKAAVERRVMVPPRCGALARCVGLSATSKSKPAATSGITDDSEEKE